MSAASLAFCLSRQSETSDAFRQLDGDGKTIELRSGDSVIVEGNVEHHAAALEDSEVLDVFTPCREDYVP